MRVRGQVKAIKLYNLTLKLVEKKVGPQHSKTAETLYSLATCHCRQGIPELALPLLRRAFEIQENIFGRNHQTTCKTLCKLGYAISQVRDDLDWKVCFTQSLSVLSKIHRHKHPDLAVCHADFGAALFNKRFYEEAIHQFLLAIDGPAHTMTVSANLRLASVVEQSGRLNTARQIIADLRNDCERLLVPGDPLLVNVSAYQKHTLGTLRQ